MDSFCENFSYPFLWEVGYWAKMEDIGLFKQGWKWLQSQKHIYSRARTWASNGRDKVEVFMERHWPTVCRGFARLGRFLCFLLLYWKNCIIRGFHSFAGLGSAALLLIMWSCFLSLTSISCLVYVLLSMVSLIFDCELQFVFKSLFVLFWVCFSFPFGFDLCFVLYVLSNQ